MYGKQFVLKAALTGVECWNFTDGKTGNFSPGETITVLSVYDSTHTTICTAKEGRPVFNRDGSQHSYPGYRFIVPNSLLATAIDADVPERTADLIGDLIAYESGDATPEQEAALFDELREKGIGQRLQGHYSRRM